MKSHSLALVYCNCISRIPDKISVKLTWWLFCRYLFIFHWFSHICFFLLFETRDPEPCDMTMLIMCQYHQHFKISFYANIIFPKKLQSQTVSIEKMHKTLSPKKADFKMLVKLTTGVDFTKILQATFKLLPYILAYKPRFLGKLFI